MKLMMQICNLGRLAYRPALDIQQRLLILRQADLIDDTLLLVEHLPVLTLGLRGKMSNIYLPADQLQAEGVEIIPVNRGGDVTYHGPGQIVGYPIMRLEPFPGSIREFVTTLESALIRLLLNEFGIVASQRTDKYTGVWVGDRKIVAIGVAVKKWVTMHGFALNVNTNLQHFDWINPCGLSMGVTSVAELVDGPIDFAAANQLAGQYLAEAFVKVPVACELADLLAQESKLTEIRG